MKYIVLKISLNELFHIIKDRNYCILLRHMQRKPTNEIEADSASSMTFMDTLRPNVVN